MAMVTGQGLADYREVRLRQGTIRYREIGEGPPIVFVHGLLVNGDLWRMVAPVLARGHRCILPDLPIGGHSTAFPPAADLSLPGVARLVADFLTALDLRDVTLVGNDSGGGICQGVVAWHPERIGRLVLTNCDAFENFPPLLIKPLVLAARLPGFATFLGRACAWPPFQRALYALVAKRFPEPAVAASYFSAISRDRGVRRDTTKFLAAVDKRDMLAAGRALPDFHHPVLVVWAPEDRLLFPLRDGQRLQATFPDARLETVAGSRTFIPEDQPERLAELIDAFVPARVAAA